MTSEARPQTEKAEKAADDSAPPSADDPRISELRSQVDELRLTLHRIQSSRGWRFLEALRKGRRRIFPDRLWSRLVLRPRREPRQMYTNSRVRLKNRILGRIPIPPGHLLFLVQASSKADIFLHLGELGARSLRDILAKNGLSLENFRSILDFGCGIGRIIRYWSDLRGPEIHGTDINPRLIAWNRKHLRFAHFQTNALRGKMDYGDGRFDFIYVLSVFTHLSEDGQIFWMKELLRVLAPGGYLLFTVHGDFNLKDILPQDQPGFKNGRMVVYTAEQQGANICAAFHPYSYVRNVLAAGLVLVDFIPEGALGNPRQDVYLFRKPE